MRIIAGSAKRKSFKSPSSTTGVRPILGRVKKSLFDILRPRLHGAAFLDIYAGSGSVGIEAISRGATSVTFVDRNPACLSMIRQNLSKLHLFSKARLVRADAVHQLNTVGGSYDIIFMGPPYHDENWKPYHLTQPTLASIAREKMLKPGGLVVGQHHAKENPVKLPGWTMFRQESYGDTRLAFFTYETPVDPEAQPNV